MIQRVSWNSTHTLKFLNALWPTDMSSASFVNLDEQVYLRAAPTYILSSSITSPRWWGPYIWVEYLLIHYKQFFSITPFLLIQIIYSTWAFQVFLLISQYSQYAIYHSVTPVSFVTAALPFSGWEKCWKFSCLKN